MADEEDLFADEHFGDFEDDADYREPIETTAEEEHPKIDGAFDEDDEKQAEPEPSPKKKKKKKKHLSVQKDLQHVEVDHYEEALDKLRNEISEAPISSARIEEKAEPEAEEPQDEPEPEIEQNEEGEVASPSH